MEFDAGMVAHQFSDTLLHALRDSRNVVSRASVSYFRTYP